MIFYADAVTDSMRRAMDETKRRRAIQIAYNTEHGIEPASIVKKLDSPLVALSNLDYLEPMQIRERPDPAREESLARRAASLEKEMKAAARELDFERAAKLRDELKAIRELEIFRS